EAGAVADSFDWVHTVAGERAARRLSARRAPAAADLMTCIQLRPEGAPERSGVEASEVPPLAELIERLPNIRLRGLMMMPLPGLTTAGVRAEFARTRAVLEKLRDAGHHADTLSMGMSGDLEAAIMEGSTLVRVGTDIFGPRNHD
ncbi:MAG: alanine racemase, partial [Gammaproteobacteria bacterium]